ncbi:MAG: EVE domain-containing protein [Oscillospiraceae bacterium]|nr:EVE domain-containing protein [Oscillospiraceae bacterium]
MIDKTKLQEYLELYKKDFYPYIWEKKDKKTGIKCGDERFKWVAVKTFQDNWDIEAADFADMLKRSLSQTGSLLSTAGHFPRAMIEGFAKSAPEEVRTMFRNLFNERGGVDVITRIEQFKESSVELLKKYGGEARNHYQDENVISTYLWLRYPDKYYIYKYGIASKVSKVLDSGYQIETIGKNDYTSAEKTLRNFNSLYDEICDYVSADDELTSLLKEHLSDDCWSDPSYRTLTMDVCFHISWCYANGETARDKYEFIFPTNYSPKLTVSDWTELLHNPDVFTEKGLQVVARIKDYGGQATCLQLSKKYGEDKNFYISNTTSIAKRICETKHVKPDTRSDGTPYYWSVLYVGRNANDNEDGNFVWKLRDELAEALDNMDLNNVELYAKTKAEDENLDRRYWMLNASPKIWSFSNIEVGEVQTYTLYNESGHKRRIFQNFLDAKTGDMIIGYESSPTKQIVAIAKVSAEQDGKVLYFEKVEQLSSPIDYVTLKSCPELSDMEYFSMQQGSLFKLTKDEYDFIMDLIRAENPIVKEKDVEKYSKEKFLNDVFMDEKKYDTLVAVLRNKKNIILQGAPGVGKTYAARRLAYSIMGEEDEERVQLVQFHQNYSYEDFIMGYKPTENGGFELRSGVFYRFCQKASNQPDKPFFFIIDEINRGNMSKIFGELLMLIEKDYRGTQATLPYEGKSIHVPKNLYIIGMMNTADRSLAMIDYALRRRFSFVEMEPAFDSEGFRKYQESLNNETFNRLIEEVVELNKKIAEDKSLGKGFCIGHSYFCNWDECTKEKMQEVVDFDIIPTLEEYWFDEPDEVQKWSDILHGVVK